MSTLIKTITAAALGLITATALAVPPKQLITHNTTDVESNAYVAGTIPSQHPTKAHSDSSVFWTEVRIACFGHTVNNQCSAVIKMATNTAEPITVGTLTMDLGTGDITPKSLSSNGYTITVNGPGETTLSADK